jgi:phage terminase small subunit
VTKLTAKEEAYARARASGKGPSDAYRASRDTSRMTTATINSNAKRLERKARIKARIEELRRGESQESRESSGSAEPTGAPGLAPSETELRAKQERFLQIFLEKGNASEAYRQAYDVSPDAKPETIHRCAAELLANPKVTTRLEQMRAELRERNAITLDHLVEALRPIAFGIRQVCDWGAAIPLKDPETGEAVAVQDIVVKARADLDDAAAAMISKIIRGKDGSLRVELHDKLAAIEKLGKLLGLIKEQHEHAGKGGGPIQYRSLEPKAPPRDVLEAYAAKCLGAIEKYAPPAKAAQPNDDEDGV